MIRIRITGSSPNDVARHDAPGDLRKPTGPDLTPLESEELLSRLGRGLRAIAVDALLDPLPHRFQYLLDALERAENPRRI